MELQNLALVRGVVETATSITACSDAENHLLLYVLPMRTRSYTTIALIVGVLETATSIPA